MHNRRQGRLHLILFFVIRRSLRSLLTTNRSNWSSRLGGVSIHLLRAARTGLLLHSSLSRSGCSGSAGSRRGIVRRSLGPGALVVDPRDVNALFLEVLHIAVRQDLGDVMMNFTGSHSLLLLGDVTLIVVDALAAHTNPAQNPEPSSTVDQFDEIVQLLRDGHIDPGAEDHHGVNARGDATLGQEISEAARGKVDRADKWSDFLSLTTNERIRMPYPIDFLVT